MQRYLTHLLADLETATRNAPAVSTYRFRHPFDDIEDGDAPAYQSRFVRLCDLFGLAPGIFPPSERLTKDQLTALLTAIEALWHAWNVSWECPARLTARRRYAIMVERMEQDSVRYNHEFGATVDFCDCRADGQCPFADRNQCWCEELEACAKHDLEIWENAHELDELDDFTEYKPNPVQEFREWLDDDDDILFPWEVDEERERWQAFMPKDETEGWLFFYDPARGRALNDETPEPSPEDFDDFEWLDEEDYGELPF
jgi:hypothetical protein